MRKIISIIFIASVLFMLSGERVKAQGTELGVIIGEPTGVSAKFWTGGRSAVDLAVAWSLGDSGNLHLHSNYLWHFWMQSGTAFYTGLGGRLVLKDDTEFAARIPLGIQFNVDRRLAIFFELAPTLPLIPETSSGFDLNGGAGVRLRF
jgi:hypothetical protein